MTPNPTLYGLPRPRSKPSTTNPTTNATFTSTLTTLLASTSTPSSTTPARPRASRQKPNIYTAATTKPTATQPAPSASTALDAATLQRSQRKLAEKARLYGSMKRGEYVPPTDGGVDRSEHALVDFDRKWAENEDGTSTDDDDEGSESDEGEEEEEMVEYEDEFGRLRRGSAREAARTQRAEQARAYAGEELEKMKARPARPATVIVGDTIQSGAFDAEGPRMAALARKRDRSVTPPEEVHYDAGTEVRSKGVGFYRFSQDGEGRAREMEALRREREGTERGKREREERKEKRRREVEARKRVIAEKRAERFLNGLDGP